MEIVTIETPELGDRSYVVGESGSGGRAVVVDPQRDLDRDEAVLASEGWTCVLVVETHLHNDYVSGGLERSRRTGAEYAVHGGDEVSFQRRPVRDGDVLTVGALEVRVVDTPGHTEHHVSYVIGGQPAAVFSGGSLLYGAVGRTDLVHPGRTEDLTHAQYHSARKLALLNDEDALYPTHGFGSMCSAGGSSGATESTIAEEKRVNVALTESDEERFVADLLAGLTAYPAYYVHMSGRNAAGPTAADLSLPAPVDPDEVAKRIAAGEWVVDLRDRTAYAAEHLAASLADLAGRTEVRGYPRRSFSDLAAEDDATVLDVRRDDEGAGGAIAGSPTSRCTACSTASTRSRRTGCGCIAPLASGPASPPACSTAPVATSCSSTTNGSTPLKPDCASSELPDDQPPSVTCQHPHGSSSSAAAPPGRVR